MKKYISIFILLIFVFGTLCAEAKTQITDECTSLSGWTVTKQNASDPTVDDGIKLSLSGSWLAYSSIEKPLTFAMTGLWKHFASLGSSSATTFSTPGFCSPTALIIPAGHSAMRGVGFPKRGSRVVPLKEKLPRQLMS